MTDTSPSNSLGRKGTENDDLMVKLAPASEYSSSNPRPFSISIDEPISPASPAIPSLPDFAEPPTQPTSPTIPPLPDYDESPAVPTSPTIPSPPDFGELPPPADRSARPSAPSPQLPRDDGQPREVIAEMLEKLRSQREAPPREEPLPSTTPPAAAVEGEARQEEQKRGIIKGLTDDLGKHKAMIVGGVGGVLFGVGAAVGLDKIGLNSLTTLAVSFAPAALQSLGMGIGVIGKRIEEAMVKKLDIKGQAAAETAQKTKFENKKANWERRGKLAEKIMAFCAREAWTSFSVASFISGTATAVALPYIHNYFKPEPPAAAPPSADNGRVVGDIDQRPRPEPLKPEPIVPAPSKSVPQPLQPSGHIPDGAENPFAQRTGPDPAFRPSSPVEAPPVTVTTIVPTTEVTTLATSLPQVVGSGELWNQLSKIPELSGGHTQEPLNFVMRVVQAKEKASQTLTAEQLQQLINYAKSTFDHIHNLMFGESEFILETYRTAHNAVITALTDESQRQAFNLANIPLDTPENVMLKDKAWQFFMSNPIPAVP